MSRVVVIGGGMSGKHAVETLLKKNKDLKITIVMSNEFVEWSMAMTHVLAHPEQHVKVLAVQNFQVPKVAYIYSPAESVDTAKREVKTASGESVPYDALVVATGFGTPLLCPKPGVTMLARRAEIQEAADRIRTAQSVVVNGGGIIGLELAGDIKCANPTKMVTLLCRGAVLKDRPVAQQYKVRQALGKLGIVVVEYSPEEAVSVPPEVELTGGKLTVGGKEMAYDVYLPAFSTGPNTSFLTESAVALDDKRRMTVNERLQSSTCEEVFGIGVTDAKEPWIGVPKLEAQWGTVAINVNALLTKGKMVAHKEGMPGMTHAPVVKIGVGRGGWAFLDFGVLPAPLKICCCGGYCGGCGPCCTCCPCGYCCCPAEGGGPAIAFEALTYTAPSMHFKGFGEGLPPLQQTMQ